ncbi:hypothetical protein [Edaphobacillus lindanitolerans]|uniref:Uncharacterized protein n=1 Tax=Edaphobacillus lindanitolerans TaxID=550447 RepID=A0A1U7PQV4_9BACI|nr:hypothetical protein [Edaphobacillus lindanitolerans]SIT92103.1 hypothetical protein SAMN05428946_2787 [Edaphobacillus lindanitolerans]
MFRFPEDQELHRAIMSLEKDIRLPMVLMDFHGLGAVEAGKVIGCSPADAAKRRDEAYDRLHAGEEQGVLERRIGLLRQAYRRITFPVSEPPVADEQSGEEKGQEPRRPFRTAAAVVVALAGVALIAGVFYFSARNGPADEVFLDRLSRQFEEELEGFAQKAGARPEELQSLTVGAGIQNQFSDLRIRAERAIADGQPMEKGTVEAEYRRILQQLEFPSDMIRRLKKEPLTDDFQASIEFYELFTMRNWDLAGIIYNGMNDYPDDFLKAIEAGVPDGPADDLSGYPEPLRKAFLLMREEGFGAKLMEEGDGGTIPYISKMPSLDRAMDSLHPTVASYVRLVEKRQTSYVEEGGIPLNEMADAIHELETLAEKWESKSNGNFQVGALAEDYFNELMFGGMGGPVFGKDGTVAHERREAWRKLAALGPGSQAAKIAGPVVEEMEESGWRKSAAYNRIGYGVYINALHHGTEDISEAGAAFPAFTLELPDEGFTARAGLIYREIQEDGNTGRLIDEPPVMTAVLFAMANEKDDDRMEALLSDGQGAPDSVKEAVSLISAGMGGERISVAFYPESIDHADIGIRVPVLIYDNVSGEPAELWLDYSASGVWTVDPAASD